MLFCYLYKLAISIKYSQKSKIFDKVLYFAFLFTFFKNFVPKTRAKFVNKENLPVVKVTSTWSPDIP